MYICIYVCICIYVYIYIHIYTYIHIHYINKRWWTTFSGGKAGGGQVGDDDSPCNGVGLPHIHQFADPGHLMDGRKEGRK